MSHLWQVKVKTCFFGTTAPSIGRKGKTCFFLKKQRHLLDVKAHHAFFLKTAPSIARKSLKACFYTYI
jgi:hypothetical protein